VQSASQTQVYENAAFMLLQDWRLLTNWRIAVQNALHNANLAFKRYVSVYSCPSGV
jgi:hypothetical protein